ncbi:MAG: helix-turn-helix transcriptional regulator [Candidatus Lokiarchaeota archaeon]|nr:helix-turn-helix transcriptional regulator [Candidatus Lokiarchaeota archaeon]
MSGNLNEALENPNRKKIMFYFLSERKALYYEQIKDHVRNDTSRPDFHLKKLVDAGLLKRIKKRGYYKINETSIQPLRSLFQEIVPICLIGGLGQLDLFTAVLAALEDISILPKKYLLLTSPELSKDFKKFDKGKFKSVKTEVKAVNFQEILRENYPEVLSNLEDLIIENINEFEIICELTGGTKPVSLALRELSDKYGLKRMYFSGKKVLWL